MTVNIYTSAAIQNELLDCIYQVYLNNINVKLTNTNLVATEADETTDVTYKSQFVNILRFVDGFSAVKGFLKFVNVHDQTGPGLSQVIIDELAPFILQNKLMMAPVMSGNTCGVQIFVKEIYPHADYIVMPTIPILFCRN